MSGREEDKHENRTEHNPRIPGASGIQKETNPAQTEEAGLCIGGGAGAGIHRGWIRGRYNVYRDSFAVLPAGRANIKNERLHNGWQAGKHSGNYPSKL